MSNHQKLAPKYSILKQKVYTVCTENLWRAFGHKNHMVKRRWQQRDGWLRLSTKRPDWVYEMTSDTWMKVAGVILQPWLLSLHVLPYVMLTYLLGSSETDPGFTLLLDWALQDDTWQSRIDRQYLIRRGSKQVTKYQNRIFSSGL